MAHGIANLGDITEFGGISRTYIYEILLSIQGHFGSFGVRMSKWHVAR